MHKTSFVTFSQCMNKYWGHVDRLRSGHAGDIIKWKENVEKSVIEQKTCRKQLFHCDPPASTSYGVCWDNVQIQPHRKHQGSTPGSQFLLWGMCLGVQNRISFHNLQSLEVKEAKQLSPYSFIPTPKDYQKLRDHLIILVERILVEHLPKLSGMKGTVEWHIPHRFSQEMAQESPLVNLGVVDADPASTSGCIQIMKHLHQFVPVIEDKVVKILCSGDGLSVERMIASHRARGNGDTESLRLEGLVECPQEFHKEILLMQDTVNKGKSEASRGTLSQMKNLFKHKSFKKEVKANVQHVWDMLLFATQSYVVLLAMTLLEMSKIDDVPSSFPVNGNADLKCKWLEMTAGKKVDFAWLAPDKEDIRRIAEAVKFDNLDKSDVFPFCTCMEDKDEPLVQCCSSACRSSWLHVSCAKLTTLPSENEDWYCSLECEQDGTYIYCLCHKKAGGRMVQCHMKTKCKKHEWYHTECVGYQGTETWYCSDKCALGCEYDDPVLNYTKALMGEGLNLLAHRDAVREGNGEQMLSHWKMDMLSFWSKKHYKYFIIGHQLLAGIAGFLPERLGMELKWNRLANMHGRKGGNIGLDLVNEF